MTLSRCLAGVVALVATVGRLAADFAIHDGDRVVFLGDSITEQRLYTTYVEAYALTRHPSWKLGFRNVGWGGDTAWLRQRTHPDEARLFAAEGAALDAMVTDSVGRGLARDVLPLRPTFVTVKFGMNDHSYQAFRPDIFRAYARSQAEIARVLGAANARVAFLTPQPIEDRRPDPDKDARNQSLRRFSDGLKDVAAQGGAAFVDQFAPYMDIMLAERAKSPTAVIGGGDAVHPGPPGQTLMAWAVLKGLGATAAVSRAEIRTATKSAVTEGCTVEGIAVEDGGVAFDRLDEALPMPVDARAEAALKLAPVLDELSRYELRVTGLAEGNYEVTIDGDLAVKTTAAALSEGVNLSNAGGPVTKQSRKVLDLVFHKNNIYFERWRSVQLYSLPGWAKAAELGSLKEIEQRRLDGEIAADEAAIDAARQPKKHRFAVRRAQP